MTPGLVILITKASDEPYCSGPPKLLRLVLSVQDIAKEAPDAGNRR